MEDYNFKGGVKDKTAFKTQRNYSIRVEFLAGWESHESGGLLRGRSRKGQSNNADDETEKSHNAVEETEDSRVRGLAEARTQRFFHYTMFPRAILSWGLS